jgi:hypothetical protein
MLIVFYQLYFMFVMNGMDSTLKIENRITCSRPFSLVPFALNKHCAIIYVMPYKQINI